MLNPKSWGDLSGELMTMALTTSARQRPMRPACDWLSPTSSARLPPREIQSNLKIDDVIFVASSFAFHDWPICVADGTLNEY